MPFNQKLQKFNAKINTVTIGSGDKTVTIGGDSTYPFYSFDAPSENTPKIGVEISDIAPVHPAFRYRAVAPNGIVENEVCPVYAARVVSEVQPNDDEVMDYQWVDLATMLSALAATPWAFSPWMVLEAENRDARQALTDFVARLRG